MQVLFYPLFILLILAFLLIAIPRAQLRALLPYGIVLGGLVDYVGHLLFGSLFKLFAYTNLDPFLIGDQLILAPLAWALIIVFYLYFWPRDNKYLAYFYLLAWAGLATVFSQVVRFIELYDHSPWFYPLPMLLMFSARFALAAWVAKPWTNSWN